MPEYPATLDTVVRHVIIDYSYRGAITKAMHRIYHESYVRIRSLASSLIRYRRRPSPREGYGYLGWFASTLRRPYAFKYFKRHGYAPSNLAGKRIVYVPLHLEPEVALLSASPEFNNSMELIALISKSLPADGVLVVKEQPAAYGIRSKHYYDNLRRMANVVLADPTIPSWDWIKAARVIATITGPAGPETVYFHRPVLSFGKHQVINHLPSVRYAHDYESTDGQLNDLLDSPPPESTLQTANEALHRALIDVSFELRV